VTEEEKRRLEVGVEVEEGRGGEEGAAVLIELLPRGSAVEDEDDGLGAGAEVATCDGGMALGSCATL